MTVSLDNNHGTQADRPRETLGFLLLRPLFSSFALQACSLSGGSGCSSLL